MRRSIFTICCLFLIGIPVAAQDMIYADVVFVLADDGSLEKVEKVKVESATYDEVKLSVRGGRSQITKEGRRVIGITFGDSPRIYLQALQSMERRAYAEAISDFDGAKNAAEVGRARKWVIEYASVKKAQCLLALGRSNRAKLPDAIAEFKKALEANKKSLLYADILSGIAEAHTLLGDASEANAAAKALTDAGTAIGHPVWKALAQRAVAQVLLEKKDYDKARSAFNELVRLSKSELQYKSWEIGQKNSVTLLNLQIEGAVEQGWVLVAWAESGQRAIWKEAETYFKSLGADSDYTDNDLVAAAVLNGLGRTMLDEKPREALQMFIKAEVTRFGAASEVARALYLKALALDKLGGDRNALMARKAREELREFYPGSVWAGK